MIAHLCNARLPDGDHLSYTELAHGEACDRRKLTKWAEPWISTPNSSARCRKTAGRASSPRRAARAVQSRCRRATAHDARRPHRACRRRCRPRVPRPARPRPRLDPHRWIGRARGGAPARHERDRAGVGGRRRARRGHRSARGVDVGAARPAGPDPSDRRGARHQHDHLFDRDQGLLRVGVSRRRHPRRDRRGADRAAAGRRAQELPRARRRGAPLPSAVATRCSG